MEEQQRGFLHLRQGGGPHRDFGKERERTLAADDQVREDVEGIVVLHERQNGEAGDVLDRILAADALHEFRVGASAVAQFGEPVEESGVRGGERGTRGWVAGIEDCAVGKHEPHGLKHAVAVGVGPAAHPGCVVRDDAAHHGAAQRCGVWREAASVGLEHGVHAASHHARLEPDPPAVVKRLALLPLLSAHHEERIAGGLAGKRGAGGPAGDALAFAVRPGEDVRDFGFRFRHQHLFGDETIEAGVGSPCQPLKITSHGGIIAQSRPWRLASGADAGPRGQNGPGCHFLTPKGLI